MNNSRRIVQSDRLRDQIYRVLLEDLQQGRFTPGQRLVELDLAAEYGVSRTPVREALFQLAREGLIVNSDRGYSLPVDTQDDFIDRLAVRISVDMSLAAHVALRASDEQRTNLKQFLAEMKAGHEADDFAQFSNAAHAFRSELIAGAHNIALARVCRVLEDQFLVMRNRHYRETKNRKLALRFDTLTLAAIGQRDAREAASVARRYMEALIVHFGGPDLASAELPWVQINAQPSVLSQK